MLRLFPHSVRSLVDALAQPSVGTFLLVLVVVDLALCGNGYLFKIGPLRLREMLFVLCMGWTAAAMISRPAVRPPPPIVVLLTLFLATTAVGVLVGFVNDNFSDGLALNFGPEIVVYPGWRAALFSELKPLAYFPMLLFFVTAIRSRSDVTLVVTILMAAGTLLSLLYLLVLASLHLGGVSYATVYGYLRPSDEIIFRLPYPGAPFVGFLYKGMYYACVSALLLMFDPLRITKLAAVLVVVAVSLTMTRSLTVALAACFIVGLGWSPWSQRARFAGQLIVLALVAVVALRAEDRIPQMRPGQVDNEAVTGPTLWRSLGWGDGAEDSSGTRQKSTSAATDTRRQTDGKRLSDVAFIWDRLDAGSVVFGHGFAAKVGSRSKIELTYFEILYKQGILGLAFWFALFLYLCSLYRSVPSINRNLGRALLLCSVFFFISTASNTVLTGSIGLGMVFITLASLTVLAKESRPVAWYAGFRSKHLATAEQRFGA